MKDYEHARAAAEEATESASEFRPQRGAWGCAYFGDAPGGIGGRQPWMSWFATKGELLEFVGKHMAFAYLPREGVDPFMAAEQVAGRIEECSESEAELGEAVDDLNRILKGIAGIDWMGTLDELLEGDGTFAVELRAGHLGLDGEAPDAKGAVPAIAEAEVERFIDDAILGYGI